MATSLTIWTRNVSDGYDVSSLAHSINYSTSIGKAGKLSFTLEKDPNGVLEIENGNVVEFYHDDSPIFYGYIFSFSTNRDEKISVTAYDVLRYFQNHDFLSIKDGEKTIKQLFEYLCINMKIAYEVKGKASTLADKLRAHFWNDVSYFDMMNDSLNEMNLYSMGKDNSDEKEGGFFVFNAKSIPIRYFLRVDMEKVVLDDLANFANEQADGAPLIIGDKSLLTNYSYSVDIDKSSTEVLFIESANKQKAQKASVSNVRENWDELIRQQKANDDEVVHAYFEWKAGRLNLDQRPKTRAAFDAPEIQKKIKELQNDTKPKTSNAVYPAKVRAENSEKLKKWGTLREVRKLNANHTEAELKNYVQLVMTQLGRAQKSLKIDALGVDGFVAGSAFILELEKLGFVKDETDQTNGERRLLLYATNVTHNYNNGVHTMSIDCCDSERFTETIGA